MIQCQKKLLLDFTVQGETSEADTPTIRLGVTPSGLIISNPPPSSPIFTPDALPASTLPTYPGLGQAPNMLACTPRGLVAFITKRYTNHDIHTVTIHACMCHGAYKLVISIRLTRTSDIAEGPYDDTKH